MFQSFAIFSRSGHLVYLHKKLFELSTKLYHSETKQCKMKFFGAHGDDFVSCQRKCVSNPIKKKKRHGNVWHITWPSLAFTWRAKLSLAHAKCLPSIITGQWSENETGLIKYPAGSTWQAKQSLVGPSVFQVIKITRQWLGPAGSTWQNKRSPARPRVCQVIGIDVYYTAMVRN